MKEGLHLAKTELEELGITGMKAMASSFGSKGLAVQTFITYPSTYSLSISYSGKGVSDKVLSGWSKSLRSKEEIQQEEEERKKEIIEKAQNLHEEQKFALFLVYNMSKTQAEIARELGVNRSTVNLWIKGKRLPNAIQREKISKCSLFLGDTRTNKERLDYILFICHTQELFCLRQ